MTNQLSKSPYIAQIMANFLTKLQSEADGKTLNKFQSEVFKEITEARPDTDIESEDYKAEFQGKLLMKLFDKIREYGHTQFMRIHANHLIHLDMVQPAAQIFENFLLDIFAEKTPTPEFTTLQTKFEAVLRQKFEAKVMELDDIHSDTKTTHFQVSLLEDKKTVFLHVQGGQPHPLTAIITKLLFEDRKVRQLYGELLYLRTKASLPTEIDDQRQMVIGYLLEASRKQIERSQTESRSLTFEENLERFTHKIQTKNAQFYMLEDGVKSPISVEEILAVLDDQQFNPKMETQSLMKKLGF